MATTEQVRELALRLTSDERALLAHELLTSLEPQDAPEVVEALWIDQMESRAAAYEARELPADDWQVSLDRVRQRLHERRRS